MHPWLCAVPAGNRPRLCQLLTDALDGLDHAALAQDQAEGSNEACQRDEQHECSHGASLEEEAVDDSACRRAGKQAGEALEALGTLVVCGAAAFSERLAIGRLRAALGSIVGFLLRRTLGGGLCRGGKVITRRGKQPISPHLR